MVIFCSYVKLPEGKSLCIPSGKHTKNGGRLSHYMPLNPIKIPLDTIKIPLNPLLIP